jgi:hypothetical protein
MEVIYLSGDRDEQTFLGALKLTPFVSVPFA